MLTAIITPDQDAVVCEVQIAAPPERIFQALTSEDQLIDWWNGEAGPCKIKLWQMDPRVGGKWRSVAYDPSGKVVINGISELEFYGEIVEFVPPRVVSYTWFSNAHKIPSHPTLVRWELTPERQSTMVRVTHSGLKHLPDGTGYLSGWPNVIDALTGFFSSSRIDKTKNKEAT